MPLTIAIVGRPNVGKSTLFNRLAGKRLAIVHDTPGVTRDRHEVRTEIGGVEIRLIDTAGFEEGEAGSLSQRMTDQTRTAIADADVCLFVVDVRAGITAGDEIIAAALRRSGKPVVLASNKSEARERPNEAEAYALGLGEPIAVSAEHALGMDELVDALLAFAKSDAEIPAEEQEEGHGPLKLAIVGRPNVGKSSLFNRLLGEERALTSPGTSRPSAVSTPGGPSTATAESGATSRAPPAERSRGVPVSRVTRCWCRRESSAPAGRPTGTRASGS